MKICSAIALTLVVLLGRACGQTEDRSDTDRTHLFIVGASLSGGFNAAAYDGRQVRLLDLVSPPLKLAPIARQWWPDARIDDRSSVAMFSSLGSGPRQLRRARSAQPDVLLGVDFPFWFGYGQPPREVQGDIEAEARWRFDRQTELFRQLDEIEGLVVVGDYPDLTDADRDMIPESLIPTRKVIRTLDSRLHAWAAQRPHVIVVALAAKLRDLLAGRMTVEVEPGRRVKADAAWALQWDRMHPTPLGMACLAQWLQSELHAAGLGPRRLSLERLATLTGSTSSFAALRDGRTPTPSIKPRFR